MPNLSDACRPSLLRRRQTSPAGPVSAVHEDYSIKKQTVSVIFSVLPLSIQSRLPPSLSRPTTPTNIDDAEKSWHSCTSSGSSTPFTESATLISGGSDDNLALVTGTPNIGSLQHHASSASGVDWRCGRPGLELLISAVDESRNAAAMRYGRVSSHDAAFERRAYLDGVSYLLKGLPQNLDDNEVMLLGTALPSSLADTQTTAQGRSLHPRQLQDGPTQPSVLHKSLRAVIARAIVWFFILWPYILVLLRWAAAVEKKHRISDQFMSQAMTVVTACGRWALGVSERICSRGNGRVGRALADTLASTVHDMVAGVSEGVQDGLWQTQGPRLSPNPVE